MVGKYLIEFRNDCIYFKNAFSGLYHSCTVVVGTVYGLKNYFF